MSELDVTLDVIMYPVTSEKINVYKVVPAHFSGGKMGPQLFNRFRGTDSETHFLFYRCQN
jgi:hypothetical protein